MSKEEDAHLPFRYRELMQEAIEFAKIGMNSEALARIRYMIAVWPERVIARGELAWDEEEGVSPESEDREV